MPRQATTGIKSAVRSPLWFAVLRDTAYSAYTLVSSVGKQRVDKLNYTSGQPASEVHLVAVLEQLTYIEQQLAALGVQI